jgi:hypothetical protein
MEAKKILAFVAIVLAGGCVPSLHELYTEDTVVFEQELVGKWTNDEEIWEFEKGEEDKSYDLTITQKEGQVSRLIVHLVKIEDELFLDLYPGDMELDVGEWYKFHLLAAHTFMKVDRIGPQLVMRAMNPDTVREMLKEKPELIKHEVVEDRVIFTASPKELQSFLTKHVDDEEFFGDAGEFERYIPPEPDEDSDADEKDEHQDDKDD